MKKDLAELLTAFQMAAAGRRASGQGSEAEAVLQQAFDLLRRQDFFDSVKELSLEKYWAGGSMHDPFLETLTFKQLLELKPANLLEKRSFTGWKVQAVVNTIRNCVEEHRGRCTVEAAGSEAGRCSSPAARAWGEGDTAALNLVQSALAVQFEVQLSRLPQTRPLGSILHAIPGVLKREEYARWLICLLHGEAASDLLAPAPPSCRPAADCTAAVSELMKRSAPALCAHWESALAAGGAAFEALIEPYREPAVDQTFQKAVFQALLASLGARPLEVWNVSLRDYWTKNEALLEAGLQAVLGRLPMAEQELRQHLETLLPMYRAEDLLMLLKQRARREPESEVWSPIAV